VGDRHYSVAQIAEATVKAFGSCAVRYVPWPQSRKAIDVGDAVISNARFKSLVAWSPRVDLAEGLSQTRDYFVPHLDKYIR
jgi:nucleoside-diphosphate-sugar epimerase